MMHADEWIRLMKTLDRIADALERIAHKMERTK